MNKQAVARELVAVARMLTVAATAHRRAATVAKEPMLVAGQDWWGESMGGAYDRVPHLNYWDGIRGGDPRFPRRKQRKVRTTKGNYTINPTQDGVDLLFNRQSIGTFMDEDDAVKAARDHFHGRTAMVSSPYSGVISPILKRIGRTDIDPRHVEAYLRMESDTGTLDAWPISKFQKLVPEMVDVIDADPVQAERLTKTMGL